MKRLSLFSIFIILLLYALPLQAAVSITVGGLTSGASFAQYDTMDFIITGLTPGATVTDQIWMDMDSNGVINPAPDVLLVMFPQTDGVGGGDGPPPDVDGSANGTITSIMARISWPVGHYVLRTIYGTDSASASYSITAMAAPTYSISGSVKISSSGVPNIIVRAETEEKSEYFGLTDATGNYTIVTNLVSGTVVRVLVPIEDFNSSISGYVATPSEDTLTLTSNVTGIDFVLTAGKIITGFVNDTLANPIANINVYANPLSGGDDYRGVTDATGKYSLAVPTGLYKVQFVNREQTNGYVITYYNQKYIWMFGDTVHIDALTDTVKNINAVLRKGGVVSGTAVNTGPNGWNISAFQYNVPGDPLFGTWFDNSGTYYFTVLPGTYSIQFNKNGESTQFFYNQITVFPGTAVTVNAIGDTVKNIDADFNGPFTGIKQTISLSPKEFSLSQNYPNPFNPTTTIEFTLKENSFTRLKVYNILGKEVATLVSGNLQAGVLHTVTFDASNLASGMYFYRLEAGKNIQVKKLILLK